VTFAGLLTGTLLRMQMEVLVTEALDLLALGGLEGLSWAELNEQLSALCRDSAQTLSEDPSVALQPAWPVPLAQFVSTPNASAAYAYDAHVERALWRALCARSDVHFYQRLLAPKAASAAGISVSVFPSPSVLAITQIDASLR
jgi:hypothetical protein